MQRICVICDSFFAGKWNAKICEDCWAQGRAHEYDCVQANNARAKALHLPGTLTIQKWLCTLEYFQWRCAYCQEAPYEVLDHFIPLKPGISPLITLRKGTTFDNCIPACRVCNSFKQNQSPQYMLKRYLQDRDHQSNARFLNRQPYTAFLTIETIQRIQEYLKIDLLTS